MEITSLDLGSGCTVWRVYLVKYLGIWYENTGCIYGVRLVLHGKPSERDYPPDALVLLVGCRKLFQDGIWESPKGPSVVRILQAWAILEASEGNFDDSRKYFG